MTSLLLHSIRAWLRVTLNKNWTQKLFRPTLINQTACTSTVAVFVRRWGRQKRRHVLFATKCPTTTTLTTAPLSVTRVGPSSGAPTRPTWRAAVTSANTTTSVTSLAPTGKSVSGADTNSASRSEWIQASSSLKSKRRPGSGRCWRKRRRNRCRTRIPASPGTLADADGHRLTF